MSLRGSFDAVCPVFLKPRWERLQASPIGMRLARGAFWTLAGTLLSRGLNLLSTLLVARLLGKEGFGELAVLQSTVVMFGAVAGLGMALTATKYISEFRARDPEKAGRILALCGSLSWGAGIVAGVLLVALAPWLAEHTLAAPWLAGLLQLSAVLLLLSITNTVQAGALAGFEAFRTIARVNALSGVLSFPVILLCAWRWGVAGALAGLTASVALGWALNHLALRREARRARVPFFPPGWIRESRVVWRFSLPCAAGSLIVGPSSWACSSIIVNQAGGYASMGVFRAADTFRLLCLLLPSLFMSAAIPVLSERSGAGDHSAYRTSVRYMLRFNLCIAVLIAAPVFLLSPWLSRLFWGASPELSFNLRIMAASVFATVVASVFMQALQASGLALFAFFANAAWAAVLIPSTYLLRDFGASGFSTALLLAFSLQAVLAAVWFSLYDARRSRETGNVATAPAPATAGPCEPASLS